MSTHNLYFRSNIRKIKSILGRSFTIGVKITRASYPDKKMINQLIKSKKNVVEPVHTPETRSTWSDISILSAQLVVIHITQHE